MSNTIFRSRSDCGSNELPVEAAQTAPNPLRRLLETTSEFLGNRSSPVAKEMKEMAGPAAVDVRVPVTGPVETVGGFDVCNEYSFTDDDEDEEEEVPKGIGGRLLPMIDSAFLGSASALGLVASTNFEAAVRDGKMRTYVLGKTYHPLHDYAVRRDDESMLFWFTYRAEFVEIKPYGICSDAGWGCMLRSAQMMLAQALRLHFKSRYWRPPNTFSLRRKDPFVRSILSWFADFPSQSKHVYSLHNMVASGLANYDKLPGEWYGPGTACYVLRDLVEIHAATQTANRLFRVHVSTSTVFRSEVHKLMKKDNQAVADSENKHRKEQPPAAHPLDVKPVVDESERVEWDTALLLLIPLRLGLKTLNVEYIEALAHTFSLRQSVGILGGRPRGARWFYGACSDGSKIFGLDPHTVQPAARHRSATVNGKVSSVIDLSDDFLRSVHTSHVEDFSLKQMDPSVALGFYCRNAHDFEDLLESMQRWKSENPNIPELFNVEDHAPDYAADISMSMNDMMMGSLLDETETKLDDEDEYVML